MENICLKLVNQVRSSATDFLLLVNTCFSINQPITKSPCIGSFENKMRCFFNYLAVEEYFNTATAHTDVNSYSAKQMLTMVQPQQVRWLPWAGHGV